MIKHLSNVPHSIHSNLHNIFLYYFRNICTCYLYTFHGQNNRKKFFLMDLYILCSYWYKVDLPNSRNKRIGHVCIGRDRNIHQMLLDMNNCLFHNTVHIFAVKNIYKKRSHKFTKSPINSRFQLSI